MSRKIPIIAVTFVLSTFLFSITRSDGVDRPSVSLKDGSELFGVFKEFHSDDLPAHGKVEAFYGIPYAKPPVGALRFKPPVPYGQLNSPFDASQIGSSCIQVHDNMTELLLTNKEMSEDCLFLDVVVPHPKPDKAPVFFSIHGGAYITGAGNTAFATFLPPVVYGGVILVTFNYRLGPFGFFYTGDDVIPGNMGLMDQQAALKWVNENIEAFGGDPSAVTIGGVSAGSGSTGFHVLSPGSRGLFRYGIMESGTPFDVWNGFRTAEDYTADIIDIARLMGCNEDEITDSPKRLQCLQRGNAEDFFEKYIQVISASAGQKLTPGPVVDGVFLPDTPDAIVENGVLNGESLIVGTNGDEGTLFLFQPFPDPETKPVIDSTMFGALVSMIGAEINSDPIVLDLIKTIYASDSSSLLADAEEEDFFHETNQFLGDRFFMCSASRFARRVSDVLTVYRYTMTYVPSQGLFGMKWAGASHGDEIQYAWAIVFEEGKSATEEEKTLSRLAFNYWLNFIKTGNPNNGQSDEVTLPEWQKFTREDEVFKDITPEMNDVPFKRRECYFHDNILPSLHEALGELKQLRSRSDEHAKWTEDGQCEGDDCGHSAP